MALSHKAKSLMSSSFFKEFFNFLALDRAAPLPWTQALSVLDSRVCEFAQTTPGRVRGVR